MIDRKPPHLPSSNDDADFWLDDRTQGRRDFDEFSDFVGWFLLGCLIMLAIFKLAGL
jgi:hypothetical protein